MQTQFDPPEFSNEKFHGKLLGILIGVTEVLGKGWGEFWEDMMMMMMMTMMIMMVALHDGFPSSEKQENSGHSGHPCVISSFRRPETK